MIDIRSCIRLTSLSENKQTLVLASAAKKHSIIPNI